jgi:SAM-dependent methyltransferase/LPS sulfotransferase NodH
MQFALAPLAGPVRFCPKNTGARRVPYTILLGRQRSGSTALRSVLVQGLMLTEHGEFLDPFSKSPVFHPDDRTASWPRVTALLDRLADDPGHHLLDIKVNSLNTVGQPFRSPILRPAILELFGRHKAPLIRLHRDPVAQWVSGQLASALGVWHLVPGTELPKVKVRIDPFQLRNFLAAVAEEDALLQRWCQDLTVLDLHYEAIFRPEGDDYAPALQAVADLIGCGLKPDWQAVKPRRAKMASYVLADNIENLDEVAHLLPGSPPPALADGPGADLLDGAVLDKAFRKRVAYRAEELATFVTSGLIEADQIKGKTVLDWECGDGAFAVALGQMGARRVLASDLWLDVGRLDPGLKAAPGYQFHRAGIRDLATDLAGRLDFVFANTVTEHMPDLPADFAAVFRVLKPGGYFFTNHDNYYQPVGSHDHGFLGYRSDGIARTGPDCWNMAESCAASQEHRQDVATRMPWTWDARNEAALSPLACEACPYYRRSQPWAHLLYQDDFRTLYPQDSFTTGQANSSLNKVTTFQLRQLLVEAGFQIIRENRLTVKNTPPDRLLHGPHRFPASELVTTMFQVSVRKPLASG